MILLSFFLVIFALVGVVFSGFVAYEYINAYILVSKEIKPIIDDFVKDRHSWKSVASVVRTYRKNCVELQVDVLGALKRITIYPDDNYEEFGPCHTVRVNSATNAYFQKAKKQLTENAHNDFVKKALSNFKPKEEEKPVKTSTADLALSKKEAKKIAGLGEF